MSNKREPDWEVVDKLPGEKKPQGPSKPSAPLLKNKTLWIGLLVGALVVIAFPILRAMLQNALRAWWIWVGLLAYFMWRRMKRGGRR